MHRFAFFLPIVLYGLPAHAASDKLCGGHIVGSDLEVSKDSATCEWPFTVPRAKIWCQGSDRFGPVFVEFPGRGRWALNGTAKTRSGLDTPDASLHAERDPNEEYGFIPLSDWIAAGHETCP